MKRSILFVDDEANLIQGLRRSLRKLQDEWEMEFANSAQEALGWLAQRPFDVIVSDVRMPGMDGSELLNIVSERYPSVIRIVLSGQTDLEMSLRSNRVAHQFINKPCDAAKLQEVIHRACQLRDLLQNPRLIQVITGIKQLPSLPSLYIQLLEEIDSPNASPKSIGAIVEKDMTMTAKILQLVNSAFYGVPTKVTSPQRAVTILGLNTFKALVLVQQVFKEFQGIGSAGFSIEQLWQHSIKVGAMAREIARTIRPEPQFLDDAQVAGVLHDIGKLIEIKIPRFYSEFNRLVLCGNPPLHVEYALLSTSHAELGGYLLGIWGLPDTIVEAVSFHHMPSYQALPSFSPLSAVHIANALINQTRGSDGQLSMPDLDVPYLQAIQVVDYIPYWQERLCPLMASV